MPNPVKPSLSQNEVGVLSSSFASSSLDLKEATSSGLILQICLIIALSLRCKFIFVSGQVSMAWSMALRTQELYTWQGSCSPVFGAEIWPHSQCQKVCFFPDSQGPSKGETWEK